MGVSQVQENRLLALVCDISKQLFLECYKMPNLYRHGIRKAKYAFRLGCALGFSEPETLLWAGVLHDVGKLLVPESILKKPGPLSEFEWEIIKKHPLWGIKLIKERCREIKFAEEVLPIVLAHHESWDGTGYPFRLKGGCIPLGARILALADVFDSLTSFRSYRPALSAVQACSVMNEMVSKKLDPHLAPQGIAFLASLGRGINVR